MTGVGKMTKLLAYRTVFNFPPALSISRNNLIFHNNRLYLNEIPKIRNYATEAKSSFQKQGKRTMFMIFALCGTAAAGFELYNRYLNYNRKSQLQAIVSIRETYENVEMPDTKATKQVIGTNMEFANVHLKMFQYQSCPFCCKVRAYIEYNGLNCDVVEVNPVFRTETKNFIYKKVPIIFCNIEEQTKQLNDSSLIISVLHSFMKKAKDRDIDSVLQCYPPVTFKNEKGKLVTESQNKYSVMYDNEILSEEQLASVKEEKKWRKWTDDWLVHLLSPNIYRTRKEALQAFDSFSEVGEWENNFSTFSRYIVIYVGAAAMYFIGKRLKKKYNLKEDVRESLYDACREWTRAIGNKRKFMGGDKPNLADLAVYGVLNSIEGCNAFEDVLQNTKIKKWYYETKKAVKEHLGCQNV
ncbi:Prostaglandin E synthase 2 [Nymphon striatum]|nr:Prostaglandin E synthase 2 [Nymphon striatum]